MGYVMTVTVTYILSCDVTYTRRTLLHKHEIYAYFK